MTSSDPKPIKDFSARETFSSLTTHLDFMQEVGKTFGQIASSINSLEAPEPDFEKAKLLLLFQAIVLHLSLKSIKTYFAIDKLLELGYLEDAYVLIRSLLDTVINLEYIKREPDTRSCLYEEYIPILQNKVGEEYRQILSRDVKSSFEEENADKIKEIESNYQRIINKCPKRAKWSSWCGTQIRQIAKQVNLEADYIFVYSFLSQFVHNTAMSQSGMIQENPNGGFQFILSPSESDEKRYNLALYLAIRYLLMVLNIFSCVFKVGQDELERMSKTFENIFGHKSASEK